MLIFLLQNKKVVGYNAVWPFFIILHQINTFLDKKSTGSIIYTHFFFIIIKN